MRKLTYLIKISKTFKMIIDIFDVDKGGIIQISMKSSLFKRIIKFSLQLSFGRFLRSSFMCSVLHKQALLK